MEYTQYFYCIDLGSHLCESVRHKHFGPLVQLIFKPLIYYAFPYSVQHLHLSWEALDGMKNLAAANSLSLNCKNTFSITTGALPTVLMKRWKQVLVESMTNSKIMGLKLCWVQRIGGLQNGKRASVIPACLDKLIECVAGSVAIEHTVICDMKRSVQ